jgi:hypothetical protein
MVILENGYGQEEEVVPHITEAVRAQLDQLTAELERRRTATQKARNQWEVFIIPIF